jgi:hypothetical protein
VRLTGSLPVTDQSVTKQRQDSKLRPQTIVCRLMIKAETMLVRSVLSRGGLAAVESQMNGLLVMVLDTRNESGG